MGEFILNVRTNGTGAFAQHAKEVAQSIDKIKGGAFGLDDVIDGWAQKMAKFATAGGIATMILGGARDAQQIEKLSRAANSSVDFMKQLKTGAGETSTEFQDLAGSYKQFAEQVAKYQAGLFGKGGAGGMGRAFSLLGFADEDLRSKHPERLFSELTARMKEGTISAEQYAAGLKLLGAGFNEVAEASRKGLPDILRKGPSTVAQSNQELLSQGGDAWDRFVSKVKGFSGTVANGVVTGVGGFLGGSAATLLGGLPGFPGDWFYGQGQRLLTGAMQSFYPTGAGGTDAMERRLVDARNNRVSREKIAALRGQLEKLFGAGNADTEDAFENLEDAGASPQMYEQFIRRARRQKRTQLEGEIERLSDSLNKDPKTGNKAVDMFREQVRLQSQMERHLKDLKTLMQE